MSQNASLCKQDQDCNKLNKVQNREAVKIQTWFWVLRETNSCIIELMLNFLVKTFGRDEENMKHFSMPINVHFTNNWTTFEFEMGTY